ncbi:MAG TPA: glycosyltransferase, partial [Bacteroidia bacterium]
MQFSIIIPTKDRGEIFYETLKCTVDAIANFDAEIIVINDSKTSNIIIPGNFKKVKLINNPKSGVASARNLGASLAQSKLLLFIDDDIITNRETIDQILLLHNSQKNICVNPNWIYPPHITQKLTSTSFGRFLQKKNLTSFKGWYRNNTWKENALFESDIIASFHLSIERSVFIHSKGYNETFSEAGFED